MQITNQYKTLCGYLPGTNSVRIHPIQNIKLTPTNNWTDAEIYYEDKLIHTINNFFQTYLIELKVNSDNKINLVVNNKIIMSDHHLFYVELRMTLENPDDTQFIEYIKDSFHDG